MAPKQAASSSVVVQRVASVNAVASVNSVANALSELLPGSTSATWRRKLAHDELYKSARAETPFGTVCQRSVVQGKRAELEIFHVNPFALLYKGAKESEHFREFMCHLMSLNPNGLSLIYYLDKATPGNQKRPDMGRSSQCIYWSSSSQCIYWSILEFPVWFRSRRNGWVPFAFVNCNFMRI